MELSPIVCRIITYIDELNETVGNFLPTLDYIPPKLPDLTKDRLRTVLCKIQTWGVVSMSRTQDAAFTKHYPETIGNIKPRHNLEAFISYFIMDKDDANFVFSEGDLEFFFEENANPPMVNQYTGKVYRKFQEKSQIQWSS